MPRHPVFTVLLMAALSGCGSELPPLTNTYTFHSDKAVLDFDVSSAGDTLHIVWVEKDSDHARAFHSSSTDEGDTWSEPVAIQTGQPSPAAEHDDDTIRLTSTGKILVVAWQTEGNEANGEPPLVVTHSNDGGQTWKAVSESTVLNASRSDDYFDLSATPGGRFHLAWTDIQDSRQSLHYTMSSNGGKEWSDVERVTPFSRQFCWHAFAHDAEHTYLLYRATAPEGLALSVQKRGQPWQDGGPVNALELDDDDCAQAGGAMAVEQTTSRRLHALVWTDQQELAGVHHLIRSSTENNWQAVGRPGGRNARSADLAAAYDGRLLATWEEEGVVYAAWSEQGQFGPRIRLSRDAQRASHPQAVTTLENGFIFWKGENSPNGNTWFMRRVEQNP